MNKLLSLLAVCLAIVPLSACKQEVSEKPAAKQEKAAPVVIRPELNWDIPKLTSNVWKISKSGQLDSYLVGTIHLGKPDATLSKDAKNLLTSKGSRFLPERRITPTPPRPGAVAMAAMVG